MVEQLGHLSTAAAVAAAVVVVVGELDGVEMLMERCAWCVFPPCTCLVERMAECLCVAVQQVVGRSFRECCRSWLMSGIENQSVALVAPFDHPRGEVCGYVWTKSDNDRMRVTACECIKYMHTTQMQ